MSLRGATLHVALPWGLRGSGVGGDRAPFPEAHILGGARWWAGERERAVSRDTCRRVFLAEGPRARVRVSQGRARPAGQVWSATARGSAHAPGLGSSLQGQAAPGGSEATEPLWGPCGLPAAPSRGAPAKGPVGFLVNSVFPVCSDDRACEIWIRFWSFEKHPKAATRAGNAC